MRLTDENLHLQSNIQLQKQLHYWKQQLVGATPVLELPTDRPRLPVPTYQSAKQSFVLPQSLSAALDTLSQQEDVTLFTILLAAFKTLLHRYSGQQDILVGSPIVVENERLSGLKANTLVLRTDISGNPSFRELLQKVRSVVLSAKTHQDLPFEKLVEELQLERSGGAQLLSYHPLFQIMFVLQNKPKQTLDLSGLSITPSELDKVTSKLDLTLSMEETEQGFKGEWEYNAELFDDATITRLNRHFQTLLEGIVANPQQHICELPLLTTDERQQLLVEWNNTQTDYSQQCIHELFEQQVERTPNAVAVVFEDKQLTYRELNSHANQLAHYLRTLGVGADVLVGICIERSLEMVVGLLGILKAGGAYVPLDPEYPQERLAFVLEDIKTPVVLTQEKLVKNLPDHGAKVICLDSQRELIAQNNQENPLCEATPDNLVYVIYTSGSTGKPKGVMIAHRGICNHLYWRQATFGLTERDKVLQTIPFSFDPSVWQIFWPLSFGGQLVMARPGGHQDPAYLVKMFTEQQITVSGLVPSIIQVLLEQEGIENCQSLRHVTTGGEALAIELGERFLDRLNLDNILINCYGPTEASIDVSTWICQRGTYHAFASIGRPIANVQTYILDKNLQPVPVGHSGELHIGGIGLARGYLNRPELTVEKFIPNPFSSAPGARLYKTGDLARYLPDGNIEFLGRIDHQVKIRGFRIELGEIEATLSTHPALQQTLVMVREDVPGDKRLVAYLVAHPEQVSPSPSELRSFLQDKLPEYMVPAAFVLLNTLPLNPNGKVDRRALPVPNTSDFNDANSFVEPRNATEEVLAAIWAQVLGLERLGIHDNFFEFGGNSLLATQVISRIRQSLSLEIPLRLLFETPTIAGLASAITQIQNQSADVLEHQTIPQLADRQSAPLSFAQQRMWFLEQMEPNSAVYLIPIAQRLQGLLNVGVLQQSLDALVAHHEVLRTNFITSDDGSPIQRIAAPRRVELKVIDLTQEQASNQEEQVQRLLNQEAQRPFDLTSDLMLRATLLQIDHQEHILLLVMHHIGSDGWSVGILWQQLAAVYEAFLNDLPNPLLKLPIQYADFAAWQRQWLSGQVLHAQLDYWKTQLAGATTVLELPTDKPRSPVQTYRGAMQSVMLPQTLAASLSALSRQEGITLFMTLVSAFGTLLHRYTGQEDILIGSPVAGRNRAEIEQLIGFFINTVVLRIDCSGQPSFRSLLNRVRQVALGAYAHQDMPFEKLVEELQPERDTSRNPLFQVWFNMLNLGDIEVKLPGMVVEPISMPEAASKFDLTLYLTEQQQGIQLELVYNADLFSADTMQRMLEHYQTLLEGIVANPEQQIFRLPLLTETERYHLCERKNFVCPTNPFIEFRKQDIEQSIPSRFEEQVRKYPHNVAVRTKNYHWTYSELNQQANRVAQAILRQCTFAEERIALLFEHDAPMIAGILGVLKVGKTYIPLDPNYPSDRVVYILENSLASAVLTNKKNLARAQELTRGIIPLINIDDISLTGSCDEIKQEISPDIIAYILYTSGSTGQPKGVIQNHRNVLHFIRNYTNNLHINEQDKLTLLSSYSFDAAIMDIFGAILNGATLYPINIKEQGLTDLSQWLQQERITIYHSTPTLYRHFVSTITGDEKFPKIRLIVLGGEEVVKTDVDLYKEHFSNECIFVNGLGPTESTVTLQYFINKQTEIARNTVPVGYPVEETEILLLNEAGEKTDIYGEIAIRSPYIALGYWDKPNLTQAVFLPDPEGGSRRIYRTGDLGRLKADGGIEFLGRKDFQVKIRGFRIELGEIEAALTQHPSVGETVVIAREDVPGDKHLVAYIVPKQAQAPTTEELGQILKQKLPEYMVPSSFVFLDNLPLTPSGKVNRRALPTPDLLRHKLEETFIAPRNEIERELSQIWEEVLGIQSISVRDNFFDLGGHSLLAIQLFAQIQNKFIKKLPLATLFQSGTVEALAQMLCEKQELATGNVLLAVHKEDEAVAPWSSLVEIQPNGSKPPLFCIHPLGGEILCYRDLAIHLGSDQPVYGLQPQGLDGKLPPYTRVEDMAAHYIKEIQTIQPNGPYFLVGYSFGGTIVFEMAQQLHRQGQKVGLLVMLDTCRPGYSKRLPFLQRILLHFKNILQQGPTYLWQKLAGWREWGTYHLKQRYKRYLNVVHDLPETDQHLSIIDANVEAASVYTFQPYPGQMTLLRTEDKNRDDAVGVQYDLQFGWGEIVTGGVDIHHLPGSHLTFLEEPNVRVLAEKLNNSLEKVQRNS